MQIFYPAIKPYAEHRLDVESPHSLYVEESGSPDGLPVLVVHGGPGRVASLIIVGFLIRKFIALFCLISVGVVSHNHTRN